MNLRDRYRQATTPPESVERAPWRERIRRDVWQIGSSVIAAVFAFALAAVPAHFGLPAWIGPAIVLWALLDLRLFAWGVEWFDLTVPWQFRVPDDTERGEG